MNNWVSTSASCGAATVSSACACPVATTQLAPKPTPNPETPTPNGPPRSAASIRTPATMYVNDSWKKIAGTTVSATASTAMPIVSGSPAAGRVEVAALPREDRRRDHEHAERVAEPPLARRRCEGRASGSRGGDAPDHAADEGAEGDGADDVGDEVPALGARPCRFAADQEQAGADQGLDDVRGGEAGGHEDGLAVARSIEISATATAASHTGQVRRGVNRSTARVSPAGGKNATPDSGALKYQKVSSAPTA